MSRSSAINIATTAYSSAGWRPPDMFLEFGGELFRGDNFPGSNSSHGKGGYSSFVHFGDDIGASSSSRRDFLYLRTEARGRDLGATDDGAEVFNGFDNLGIASLVYKWAPDGNPTERNLKLSGEYFYQRENGSFDGAPVKRDNDGWYLQGVYQFMPQWKRRSHATTVSRPTGHRSGAGRYGARRRQRHAAARQRHFWNTTPASLTASACNIAATTRSSTSPTISSAAIHGDLGAACGAWVLTMKKMFIAVLVASLSLLTSAARADLKIFACGQIGCARGRARVVSTCRSMSRRQPSGIRIISKRGPA